jgi:hypothetical protein
VRQSPTRAPPQAPPAITFASTHYIDFSFINASSHHGNSYKGSSLFCRLLTKSQSTQTTKQRLALAIIDFLSASLKDGSLSAEDADSVEVAQNCIAESFHVDASDEAAMSAAVGGQNLLQIYGVYEKLKGKTAAGPGTNAAGEKVAPGPSAGAASPKPITDAQKKEAESLKSQGNSAMAVKNYPSAIDLYSKALALVSHLILKIVSFSDY